MNSYSLLIFIHVLGAIGMFAAWSIEFVTLLRLRQAGTLDEARICIRWLKQQRSMEPVAMLVVIATGIWMGIVRWNHQPWMVTALFAMVVIAVVGVVTAWRSLPRLKAKLPTKLEQLPTNFVAIANPLAISLQLRVAIGIGILGLMTAKPDMPNSLIIISIALVIGTVMAIRTIR